MDQGIRTGQEGAGVLAWQMASRQMLFLSVESPQEHEPGCGECSISAISTLIATDNAKEDALWCLAGLEIVDN